ncbi:DNA helicase [Favolaschia claudopus]|uniref:DNA helicase n=1 Tax=Favolaschia claudopus TaxID=2862362 RepID=A0AAW0BZK2_9AGAR
MSSKRGRKRNDNLPPNRARDVQRAFRARRAAHLLALEQRVAELEEENSCFRQALNLPQASRPPLGKGPTGKDKPKSLYESGHNGHNLLLPPLSSQDSSSADSPESLRDSSVSPAPMSATLPSARQDLENGTGPWGQTIVMTEEEIPQYSPMPPLSAPPSLPPKMPSFQHSRSSSLAPMYNMYSTDRALSSPYSGYFDAAQHSQSRTVSTPASYTYSPQQGHTQLPYSPIDSPVHEQMVPPRPVSMYPVPPQRRPTSDLQTLGGGGGGLQLHYPPMPPPTPVGNIRLPSPPRALQDPQRDDLHNHGHHSQLDPHAAHHRAYTADGRIIS